MAKKDYFEFLKEKQRKVPTPERAERLAKRGIKTPATDSDIEPDMRDMAGTTAGYGSTVDPETYDLAGGSAKPDTPAVDPAQNADDQLAARRGIASGLKDLSKRGALTADLLKEARQRATKAGVSEDQFSSFMEKEGIRERGSAFSFKKPKKGTGLFDQPATGLASSPEEARANVIFQRKFGTGLDALKAMQDPSYEVGSGSSLLDKPESKESDAGRLARIGRKVGGPVGKQLQQASAIARLTQPSIMTKDIRRQDVLSRKEAGKAAMLADAAAERARKEEEERKKKEGAESGLLKSAESYELPKLTKAYSGVGKGSKNNSLRQS